MSDDLALIGVGADTSGLKKGEVALDSFANKGEQTEKRVAKSTGAINSEFQKIEKLLKVFGSGFAAGILIKELSNLEKEARQFHKALAEVSTLLDDTSEMSEYNKQAKELAKTFGGLPEAQAKSFYSVISAGAKNAAEATATMTAANKLAIGGVTDIETAVDGLTSVLNAYQMEGTQATAVSDAFFVAMKAGKTTVGELSSSVGNVASIASAAGVSLDELLASASALTTGGIKTSVAMNSIRQTIVSILKPTKEAADEADRLGLKFDATALKSKGLAGFIDEVREKTGGSQESLTKLFGSVEALNAVIGLTGPQFEKFNQIVAQMGEKAGQTETAYDKMSKTMAEQANQLSGKFAVLRLEIGEKLGNSTLPVIQSINENFDELVSGVVDGVTLISLVIAGRLVGATATATAAFVRATAASFNYQLSLAKLAGVSGTAATSQLVLGRAVGGLRAGLALIGGPAGAILLAVGAFLTLRTTVEDVKNEVKSLDSELDVLKESFDDVTRAQKEFIVVQQKQLISSLEKEIQLWRDKATALSNNIYFSVGKSQAEAQEEYNNLMTEYRAEIERVGTEINSAKRDLEGMQKVLDGTSESFKTQDKILQSLLIPYEDLHREGQVVVETFEDITFSANELKDKIGDEVIEEIDRLVSSFAKMRDELDPIGAETRKLESDLKDLKDLLDNDFIDHSTWLKMSTGLLMIEEDTRSVSTEVQKIIDQATPFEDAWVEATKRIDESFAQAWRGAFDSFGDFASSLKDAFINLLAELAHLAITKPILIQLGLGGGSTTSGILGSLTGTSGSGTGIMDLFSNFKSLKSGYDFFTGLFSTATTGVSAAASYGAGIGAGGATASGVGAGGVSAGASYGAGVGAGGATASGAGGIGQTVAGYADGVTTYAPWISAIGGALQGYETGKNANVVTGAVGGWAGAKAGAYAGGQLGASLGPYGAAIGAALGAVVGGIFGSSVGSKVFGTDWQAKDGGIAMGVDAMGVEAQTYLYEKKEGGWFGSTKRRTTFENMDEEVTAALNSGLEATKSSIVDSMNILGFDVADDILDSFSSATEKFSTQGKTEAEVGEMINGWFAGISEDMARAAQLSTMQTEVVVDQYWQDLAAQIEAATGQAIDPTQLEASLSGLYGAFSEVGNQIETLSFERLTGLAATLTSTNDVFATLNLTAFESSIAGAQLAESLIYISGGIEGFMSSTSQYYDLFYSEQEKLNKATADLTAVFEQLNLTTPTTKAQFRELVEGLDLTTTTGQETFAVLMQIAPAFAEVASATAGLAGAAGNAAGDINSAASSISSAMSSLAAQQSKLKAELAALSGDQETADSLNYAAATEGLTDEEITVYDENQALLAQIEQIKNENATAIATATERARLEQQLLTLQGNTTELRVRELATLYPSNIALQEEIWALQDAQQAASEAALAIEDTTSATEEATSTERDLGDARRENAEAAKGYYDILAGAVERSRDKVQSAFQGTMDGLRDALSTVSSTVQDLTRRANLFQGALDRLSSYSNGNAELSRLKALSDLRTKDLSTDELSRSLSDVTNIDQKQYGTFSQYAQAIAQTQSLVLDLMGDNQNQLSSEEMLLAGIEQQMEIEQDYYDKSMSRFDGILEAARMQVDKISGVEASSIGLSEAIRMFEANVGRISSTYTNRDIERQSSQLDSVIEAIRGSDSKQVIIKMRDEQLQLNSDIAYDIKQIKKIEERREAEREADDSVVLVIG